MKTGRSLMDLVSELDRRANAKQDFVGSTKNLELLPEPEGVCLGLKNGDQFAINSVAHDQIGGHVEIPAKYYDRMLEKSPALLRDNVNHWFKANPTNRMVRTMDGTSRAFLSDKFSIDMDNEDFFKAVYPVLKDLDLDIMSCDVTDRRLYIKAVDRKVSRELAKTGARMGDGGHTIVRVVAPAITISNSEVGLGALSVQGGVFDRWCSNLGSFGERSMRKAHVGGRHEIAEGELYAMLSDNTKKIEAAALWSKVRDVVRGVFDLAKFNSLVDKIEGTQADKIESDDIVLVVKKVSTRLSLNETEQKSTLKHLIEGGDLSRFGLFNAVTRTSQDEIVAYDRATELERLGAQIVELPKAEWRELAAA